MDNFEFENKKKKKLRKEPFYIVGCLLCLVIGAGGGYFYRGSQEKTNQKTSQSLYDQIYKAIESDFLDTTESENSLKDRMLYGMVAALGDPYTSYLSTQEAQSLTDSINGSVQGIGITFSTISVGGVVLAVYKGTPAEQAGLLSGDIITHVQGTSVAGYSSEKIKNAVSGESGTSVALKVLRNGKSIDLTAKRASVETSLSYEIRTSGQEKIGYLQMTTFGEGTAAYVEEALKAFQKENIQTLVIDLRDNGGGYLKAAQDILDLFIEKDKVLVSTQTVSGKIESFKSTDIQKYHFENGYVLCNGDTASASEVMIGALKEYLNYKLVGTKTYGKGIAQTQLTLSDSSVLKYTNAKWLTPNGNNINGEGFKHDYEVKSQSINDFHIGEFKGPYQYDQVDDNIQYMQEMLKELGYKVDRVDGYYSKATEEALKAFEKRYGLAVNGIYDKNDATIVLSALLYHIYQELEDAQYLKVTELIK